MAWTAPITFVGQSRLTAAQLNSQLRDNMLETMPGKATNPGSYFVTTAPNEISERLWGSQFIDTAQFSASTSYTDLASFGPSITATTTSRAIVLLSCNMQSTNNSVETFMSVQVSGATTRAASDTNSVSQEANDTGTPSERQFMRVVGFMDLTPGVNTFTAKYRSSGASGGTFQRRRLTVLPF